MVGFLFTVCKRKDSSSTTTGGILHVPKACPEVAPPKEQKVEDYLSMEKGTNERLFIA